MIIKKLMVTAEKDLILSLGEVLVLEYATSRIRLEKTLSWRTAGQGLDGVLRKSPFS